MDEQARPSCRGYDETMQLIQNVFLIPHKHSFFKFDLRFFVLLGHAQEASTSEETA